MAAARSDVFYEIGFGGPWDVAAGALVLTEAGGVVIDPAGAGAHGQGLGTRSRPSVHGQREPGAGFPLPFSCYVLQQRPAAVGLGSARFCAHTCSVVLFLASNVWPELHSTASSGWSATLALR